MHANELTPGPLGTMLPALAPEPFTGEGDPMLVLEPQAVSLVEPSTVPAPSMTTPCPGLDRLWDEEDSGDAATWSVDEVALRGDDAPPDAEPWLEPEQPAAEPAELPDVALEVLR